MTDAVLCRVQPRPRDIVDFARTRQTRAVRPLCAARLRLCRARRPCAVSLLEAALRRWTRPRRGGFEGSEKLCLLGGLARFIAAGSPTGSAALVEAQADALTGPSRWRRPVSVPIPGIGMNSSSPPFCRSKPCIGGRRPALSEAQTIARRGDPVGKLNHGDALRRRRILRITPMSAESRSASRRRSRA